MCAALLQGRFEEALALATARRDAARDARGAADPASLDAASDLALLLKRMGRREPAVALLSEVPRQTNKRKQNKTKQNKTSQNAKRRRARRGAIDVDARGEAASERAEDVSRCQRWDCGL